MIVAIFVSAPHRSSGMKRFAIAVHDAVDNTFFINTIMSLSPFGKLVQGTARSRFSRM
jgi:hypothetical protein